MSSTTQTPTIYIRKRTGQQSMPVVAMGIDPGYDRLGWAVGVLQSGRVREIQCGCIETDRQLTLHQRYGQLATALRERIAEYNPSEVAIETLYFSKNKTTALAVSEARGIIIAQFLQAGVAIFEYTPPKIKLAVTGSGRADKAAVKKMVQLQTGVGNVTRELDDALDAVGALMTHATMRGLR